MKYGFLSPQTTVGTTNYSVHGRAGLPPGAGVGRATGSDHSGPCICPPARGLQTVSEGMNVLEMSAQVNNQENVNLCSEHVVCIISGLWHLQLSFPKLFICVLA